MTVKALKERPIIFNTPMVNAIINGRKTQTRRLCKPMNSYVVQDCREVKMHNGEPAEFLKGATLPYQILRCPYGKTGDLLWVREKLSLKAYTCPEHNGINSLPVMAMYEAGGSLPFEWQGKTGREIIPSIHMPRWASRITLRITNVRVERLRDISNADALAEGVETFFEMECTRDDCSAFTKFAALWSNIHSPESWHSNPWVWVVEFERVD